MKQLVTLILFSFLVITGCKKEKQEEQEKQEDPAVISCEIVSP